MLDFLKFPYMVDELRSRLAEGYNKFWRPHGVFALPLCMHVDHHYSPTNRNRVLSSLVLVQKTAFTPNQQQLI